MRTDSTPAVDVAALTQSLGNLSDRDLLQRVHEAVFDERRSTVELIALLMEVDARRLFLAEGCSSLFTYCTQVLHLSEHAAYGRIEAARAARKFPLILERLADGRLTLTAVGLLASQLTPENHVDLLEAACHKSKRDVERVVARLNPRPDVAAVVRKLPDEQSPPSSTLRPAIPVRHQPKMELLAPARYKTQFTVGREAYERLRRVQDLLRHSIPTGDVGAIFERALELLLTDVMKTKVAAAQRPRARRPAAPGSRHVPASVRREVWQRDGGRCAFIGTHGRCMETGFLEFHHIVPLADGGEATSKNLELRCRAHNAYEAERWFGPIGAQPPLFREGRSWYG